MTLTTQHRAIDKNEVQRGNIFYSRGHIYIFVLQIVKISIVFDMTPYCLVGGHQRFRYKIGDSTLCKNDWTGKAEYKAGRPTVL